MARRLSGVSSLVFCLILIVGLAGCGVKTPPIPSDQVAPAQVTDLTAVPALDGVKVSFSVPQADKPRQVVERAYLFYGYLPLTGDPECPPCPPRLRKYRTLNLITEGEKVGQQMKGGRFEYLDTAAPVDMEAVYEVVLEDAAGRESIKSNMARTPRLSPAAAPAGLSAKGGDTEVVLAWEKVKVLDGGRMAEDISGYMVEREGPDGVRMLNVSPTAKTELKDKTVINGATYRYRVYAARSAKGVHVPGKPSAWAEAKPQDRTPPSVPADLNGVGQPDGNYLRFSPSPDQDVAGYRVYRQLPGGGWEEATAELITTNTFVDKGVVKTGVYLYKVKAVDASGNESEFSEVLEVERQQ